MDQNATVIVVAVVVAIAAVIAWLLWQRGRSARLRQRFGSEYEREVSRAGDVRSAEAELAAREKRVARLQIRPLPPDEAQRFTHAWRTIQTQFVDDPLGNHRPGELTMQSGHRGLAPRNQRADAGECQQQQ